MDLADPYASLPGAHFNDVLARFGAPIFILNLVKVCVSLVQMLNPFMPYAVSQTADSMKIAIICGICCLGDGMGV